MELDEFALIRLLTGRSRQANGQDGKGVAVGIGDDAAVLDVTPGMQLVVTCDTMVQEVHFTAATMAYGDIGFKAMASNLSDLAAMGAVPRFALVSISVPADLSETSLGELYAGLYECADRYGTAVVGGDTTSSSLFTVSVTAIGEVEAGRALLRSASRPGHAVFVTGEPGRSAAGLHYLLRQESGARVKEEAAGLVRAHRRPLPAVEAGRLLAALGDAVVEAEGDPAADARGPADAAEASGPASHAGAGRAVALNDVSDGLASESWEIAEASGCGIVLAEAALPIGRDLQAYADSAGCDPLDWLLYGGEDYVLLGTLPAGMAAAAKARFEREGLAFHVIGAAVPGPPGVWLDRGNGVREAIAKKGYNHFGRKE